jgi:hypothetical protein
LAWNRSAKQRREHTEDDLAALPLADTQTTFAEFGVLFDDFRVGLAAGIAPGPGIYELKQNTDPHFLLTLAPIRLA